MNKCLTVLLNTLIWDQHANPQGIFCLFICIAGGIIYKQAPMRGEQKALSENAPSTNKEGDEETASFLPQSSTAKLT